MCSPLLVVDATLDKSKFKPSHYFRSHRKKKKNNPLKSIQRSETRTKKRLTLCEISPSAVVIKK